MGHATWWRGFLLATVILALGGPDAAAGKLSSKLQPLKLNIEFYWYTHADQLATDPFYVERFVAWEFPVDARIAAFHVYEQAPGASSYQVYHTIHPTGAGGRYDVVRTDDRWMYVVYGDSWWSTPGWGWVQVWDRRNPATAHWPVGQSKLYVVAVDAQGQELNRSRTMLATVFNPMVAHRPTEGAVVEPMPTLAWDEVLAPPPLSLTKCSTGVYQPQVYDRDSGGPGWSKNVPLGRTSVVYDGLPLTPGHRLAHSNITYVNDQACLKSTVGVGIGVLPTAVDFTVE